ncbi:hypothetical protein Tco_0829804 [Tanacetum coccineum]
MGDTIAQTRFENVSKHSNDSLLARGNTLRSDEDRLKLKDLMELCTNLQNKVLDLEKTKTTQQNEIASLKKRVKKLEQKKRSRTHGLKRLRKVGFTARVKSSGDEENDADKEMFDVDALNGEEVFVAGQNENVAEEVVDAAQVSTAATTVIITTEEITLAQALEALKTSKPKVKGIIFQEPDEEEVAIDDIPLAVKSPSIIYMLVEKKYLLTPSTLSMMLEKKLMIDYESKNAYRAKLFIVKHLRSKEVFGSILLVLMKL